MYSASKMKVEGLQNCPLDIQHVNTYCMRKNKPTRAILWAGTTGQKLASRKFRKFRNKKNIEIMVSNSVA